LFFLQENITIVHKPKKTGWQLVILLQDFSCEFFLLYIVMQRKIRENWALVAQEYLKKANQGPSKPLKRTVPRKKLESNLTHDYESKHRIDREVDLLLKAAQASLICGKYKQSAEAFEKAACLLHSQQDERIPSALLYCEAGFCQEMLSVGRGEDDFSKSTRML
jgi:hypothetical protein